MKHHSGKDIPPSRRGELSQVIDGFDELAVVRVDTVLRNDRESVETQLKSLYTEYASSGYHNMESGESDEVQRFWDPTEDTICEDFETVITYLRSNNSLFVDLITVAVLDDETHNEIIDDETPAEDPQRTLEEFFSKLSTINAYYTEETDDLDGLPVTSLIVGIPSSLPPVRTAENGFDQDRLQQFTEENETLCRTINFPAHGPASVIVPETSPPFLISNQSHVSPLGPYSAIYFHTDHSIREIDETQPTYRYADGFRTLVPLFRRFNWLRHRRSQIGDAESHLLEANNQLDQTRTTSFWEQLVGDVQEIAVYEQILEQFRSDVMVATQIQQEQNALGNPYHEKTSLAVEIEDAFPLSENLPHLQMVNDGVYQNLIVYCSEDEKYVRRTAERVINERQTIRESLFAEISVTSTRQNIRLQRVLLVLTAVLMLLTVVMVLPIIIDFWDYFGTVFGF